MFFRRLFSPKASAATAREIYLLIVAKARQPYFYSTLGVADNVDGRFDMIALHAIMVMERLARGGAEVRALSQPLFDEMFADMDRSLREMGVGDLSVGKKVRRMAEVFYGRAAAYRQALERGDEAELAQAVARNVYRGEAPPGSAERLSRYVMATVQALGRLSESDIRAGLLQFPDPQQIGERHGS